MQINEPKNKIENMHPHAKRFAIFNSTLNENDNLYLCIL